MAIRLETPQDRPRARRVNVRLLVVSIAAVIALLSTILFTPEYLRWRQKTPDVCTARFQRPRFSPDPNRINERHVLFPDQEPVLLLNATLIDGDGKLYPATSIFILNSTIVSLNSTVEDVRTVDLHGHFVTPGLVDMHSHFGTRPQPQLKATEDTNEYTSPITPFVRSLDGIDPLDPELPSLAASGVTSHLVLTGSKNLISGESYVIKMIRPPRGTVEEMLVQYNVPGKIVRWLKMAFGENEKQTGLEGYPVSRIGAVWRIREALDRAKSLMQMQDNWCSSAHNWARPDTFPTDIHLDTLVSLLRGDVGVHVHLYETYDFQSLIRVSEEFGFHIEAFHHALSAYKIPEVLKEYNTTIAIFADEWGQKKEQYEASVWAPKLLEEAGIPVALKTDHPALPGQQLLYFAQIAHHWGLKGALESVTGIPALGIGMGHRIGFVRPGYDADLIVWDRHPLNLGVTVLETVVDGVPMFDFEKIGPVVEDQSAPLVRETQKNLDKCDGLEGKKNVVVHGIKESVVPGFVMSSSVGKSLVAVITDGKVSCVGEHSHCITNLDSDEYTTLEVSDGFLTSGVTSISEGLGLREMVLEPSTSDGNAPNFELLNAADGIHLDGLVLERLSRSGITQGITPPLGDFFTKGYSTHFRFASPLSTSIVQEQVAVHFNVGHNAKSTAYPTVSSQISALREFIESTQPFLPLAIHTHNSGVISQVIRLKAEFPHIRFIIVGGQEAHLVASELATAEIPVVLTPWRCNAKFWENRHCSVGCPLERPSVDILYSAGVEFAIAYDEPWNMRRLFWEASEAAKSIDSGLTLAQSVGLITTNLEKIFNVTANDDVLVFERNPLEFGASLSLSIEKGAVRWCFPDPEEPVQGDLLF